MSQVTETSLLYDQQHVVCSRNAGITVLFSGRQRLLKPFKIRDTAFVRFHSSYAWVKVVHTHILQNISFMLRDRRWSIHRWDNYANATCIKYNDGAGMTDDIPDVPAMVGQIYEDLEKEKTC